ncbi:hypothetical protein M446_0807 [Methylobacterium sp. 4-46]|nr:hypothetical protein M446_0807 [Methylobacterium sp. 4-46]
MMGCRGFDDLGVSTAMSEDFYTADVAAATLAAKFGVSPELALVIADLACLGPREARR